ncbi:MAG: hypothetical protein EBR49_10280 [Betaproteobacteria bacterium]|nr:hypothetical protein [Betaproteobacteria bacterium]
MSEVLERAFDATEKSKWQIKTLGEVCRTSSGGTPSRSRPDFFNGKIPWVKSGELTDGLVSEVSEFISEEALAGSSAKLLPAGTLLIAMYGATVGKLGVLARAAATNQAVCAIFPPPELDLKFLFWYLRRQRSNLIAKAVGGAQPNISQTILRDLELPIPPLGEQREIVAEIEKQFSRLDEAVANLQRVKANLKRYKASVLKAAVEGRLVESEATLARREGRTYETGEQLLQRILEERRAKWTGKGKYKEPVKADAAGLSVPPEGWATASLDMISTDSGYGISQKCGYENDGPAVLRIPNVQHGVLDLHDLKFAPTEFKLGQYDAVSSGDMLIIRTNGSKSLIGRAAVVMAEPQRKMSFASYLIRFRLSSADCIPAWVSVVWQTSQMRQWIESHAATSAGQHNVSMTVLAKAAIPVPPVVEQTRIVAEVDRHLSIIREVEAEVDANLQRAQALRQSTLAKAFSS